MFGPFERYIRATQPLDWEPILWFLAVLFFSAFMGVLCLGLSIAVSLKWGNFVGREGISC